MKKAIIRDFLLLVLFLSSASCAALAGGLGTSWKGDFEFSGVHGWGEIEYIWGAENIQYLDDEGASKRYMRVSLPKGTYNPKAMRDQGLPVGGCGFKAHLIESGSDHALLTYKVRFPEGFQFVRGGKLPGLFGGAGNSGGSIPNGLDGFSFRLMWLTGGYGEVYAYLPSSVSYGTPLLFRKFKFEPGRWHNVRQELRLNTKGDSNGSVKLWLDDQFIGEASGLEIRKSDLLKINGIFFDVFYGGADATWAAPEDTYIDFSEFSLMAF